MKTFQIDYLSTFLTSGGTMVKISAENSFAEFFNTTIVGNILVMFTRGYTPYII